MPWLTSNDSIKRYNEALQRATSDDEAFNFFRRADGIREIVEGIPACAGQGYYNKLRTSLGDTSLTELWNLIVENDRYGSPETIRLDPHGFAASTTMRYAWNVVDMKINNVVLDDVNIVEIGGGYGGLCRMIHTFHKPKSYTIIDLPNALALAKRYLKCYDIHPRMLSCETYDEEPIDTLISNYALTELTRATQITYINKLLKRSKYGYITYNSQPRNMWNQFSLNEIRKFTPGISQVYEENIRRSECQVLTWKPQ
jgi:hypothetical protein